MDGWRDPVLLIESVLLAVGVWFTIGCILETRRMLRAARARVAPSAWPALQILRPCAGDEPGLFGNLCSTATARYDGPREIVLLVASTSDPAYTVCSAVREAHPNIALVVTGDDAPYNRKVAQLARAPQSAAPIIVVVDSDIELDDTTLPALVTALLSDEKAGAASCPPVDVRPRTLGDHASAALLSSTPHALYCLAALAERSGGAHVLCGAFIAIHRRVLAEVGGFAELERYLGEDFELARRLHARGYTIPTAAVPGRVTDRDRSLRQVASRFRRWCTVTRQQRPHLMATYQLLLGSTPMLVLLAAVVHTRPLLIATALYLLLRMFLAATLRGAYGLRADPLRSLVALLLGEALIFVAATGALGRPVVTWRGHRFVVGREGLLRRVQPEAA